MATTDVPLYKVTDVDERLRRYQEMFRAEVKRAARAERAHIRTLSLVSRLHAGDETVRHELIEILKAWAMPGWTDDDG